MIKNQTTLPSKFQIMSHPHQWEPGIVRIPCHWERLSVKASPAYHGDRGDKEHSFQPGGYWNRRNIMAQTSSTFFSVPSLHAHSPPLLSHSGGMARALSPREPEGRPPPPSGPPVSSSSRTADTREGIWWGNQPTVWYNCLQTTAASRLTNRMTSPDALTFLHASPSGSGYPQSHRVTAQFTAFTATLPTGTSLS